MIICLISNLKGHIQVLFFQVARLTHAVSLLSEGILGMKNTLVGIVKIDPKKLLEDGIRRELVQHISFAFHDNVRFDLKSKVGLQYSRTSLPGAE